MADDKLPIGPPSVEATVHEVHRGVWPNLQAEVIERRCT